MLARRLARGLTRGRQHDICPALQDGRAQLWRQPLPVAPRAPKPHFACKRQQPEVRCTMYEWHEDGWSGLRTAGLPEKLSCQPPCLLSGFLTR